MRTSISKQRIFRLLVILAILGVLLFVFYRYYGIITSTHPRVVDVAGSPEQIGTFLGKEFAKELLPLYDKYIKEGFCRDKGMDPTELEYTANKFWPYIPEDHRREIMAMAHASGFSAKKIVVLSVLPELALGRIPPLCSAFAWRRGGKMLVGRNLDWMDYSIAHKHGCILRIQPKGKHAFLSVSWPGMVGIVTGVSDAGLSVSLNIAFGSQGVWEVTPMLFRLRQILEEAETLDQAQAILLAQWRPLSCNVLVASANENRAIIVEMSDKQSAILSSDKKELIVTTNYYQLLAIPGGVGKQRHDIIVNVLHNASAFDISHAIKALRKARMFSPFPRIPSTIQSVVFDFQTRRAYVAIGKNPATSGKYYPVNFMPKSAGEP